MSDTATLREPDVDEPGRLDDEDDLALLPRRPRRRVLTPLTLVLAAVIVAAGGFIGGIEVQKGQGGSTAAAASPAAAGLARAGAGGAGRGGFPGAGAGGGGGGATTGTVASKSGRTLYVTGAAGTTKKVRTTANTKVTRTASSGVAAIHPGDTVVVTGSGKAGTTVAARITATQKGASAFPAFGGGFGRTP